MVVFFRIIVTGVLADRFPADLHLFRNYTSGEHLLRAQGGNAFAPTPPPDQQLVWRAARASGAAPSYFRFVFFVLDYEGLYCTKTPHNLEFSPFMWCFFVLALVLNDVRLSR